MATTARLSGSVAPLTALHAARAVGATVTPEAALVAADGSVVYRGALNDRIAPNGVMRWSPFCAWRISPPSSHTVMERNL